MAWKPPEDELDQNLNQQWKPPKNELDWKPPEEELDNSPTKIKDVGTLQQMKASGQKLTDEQEKLLWKYEEDRPLLDKAGEAVRTFFPAAAKVANQLGTGSVDLIYKGVLKPIDAMSQTPEEVEKTFKEAGNAWRSFGSGAMSDMEETIDMATRFSMFGSGITDKLQGLPEEERFKRFKNREVMRQFGQAVREEMPDRAAAIISENPFLKKAAGAYAKLAGGTPEEVKMAEEAFTELVKESGLTKEELDENISMLGEFMSPVALPGGNRITGAIAKPVGKVVQKTGELALKGIKPIAELVEGGADLTLKGTELIQGGAKKLGEYTVNDQDTWFKTTANTIVTPVNLVAKPTRSVARVVKDVTAQADVGGAAGRRGLFERAGRAGTSSDLTRRLFGPQGKGGVARAKVADWTVRQANAIIQPGVNGAALNVLMGLPDIETAAQLGEVAGAGFGIGGFAGARVFDRAGAIIDPTTSLAEKITTVVTPDMAQRRRDEDADIKRFLATATPEMKSQMADLSNIDKRKTAIDSKLINLRQQKERTINAADEANLQRQIDGFEKQRQALEKATPETVREAERQVQLAFMDAMDLAQATGTSAGLRGLNLTVLNADNAEGFFRNLYGGAVERAEGVVNLLTGRTDLTMQESQNLQQARELLNRFSTEVAGAKNQRGFAIGVDGTDPNADGYVAPHLRKVNQTDATAVINGDLVKHLSEQGFDVRRVINHEMQHALQQFREVKKMLSPIRGDLFDQKVVKDDGTVEVWKQGIFSDADIARYGANYAAKMSPADNGASFIAQFQDVDAFTAYIKDEILAEVASQTGDYSNGTRAALDDVGRNLVDWLEVKTKAGALRKMKEGLRTFGIVFDNYGGYSNVLGADLPPEALAMIRQYQRQLRDFDGSMQIQTTREQDAPDIPMTAILGSRALQEKYKDADFFEKEQILRSTAPDGTVTEIVMPKGAKLDPFVDIYRIQGGQLVDANGKPIQLPPEITFGSLPEGSTFQMDTRIARKSDGSPITLSPREIKSRALERTQSIRNVIDSAPDDGTPNRLIDTGNGNYRGVMSPSQLAAVLSIPNNVLAPALKRQIQFFNELMQRGDGTRAIFEYQAALLNGRYKAISPKIRDEVPIGWQFTKDGNFALTTMSVSRLYDKLQAWADQGTVTQEQTWTGELIPVKRSKNLALWNGDTNKFWNSLVQVLDNHANGREGWVGLHSDELTAKRMRNKVNDLFNVFNKETKEMNPDRSTLPRVRGRDNVDIIVRSRRVDRINSFSESPSTKVPVNYGKLLINYMPETNPLAAPQTPEQFMENINGSVSATRIRNAIATGAVDQLETELRNSDDLLPTESLFVSQGEGGDPVIQVTSMLDPNVEGALEPEEVVVDLDARTAEELARLEAEEAAAMAAQQQAQAPAEPAPAPEPAPEPAPAPTTQFMPAEGDFEQIRRDAIDKRNKRRDEAYEILYSVIPETADILKRKINFEDDQQEFNSIPFSMPSVGFDYDRSFHLTKIVRRILDTLDPMADTKAIQNLRRKWDTASPIDKQDIEDRIKKYEDRIKKTASTMKYAFGVFADLTASLPEAKARDLRQDKIVDPWVVLKKHFPNGESKDINKVILELRDIIKFGIEKENFKSSINNVLNAAEILRDFTDVDQSVIDQLFKDRYNKSEAQIKKDEEEFFKEVTNPEFYNVEKRGTATFSQKIEPQGGIQFMPAEAPSGERGFQSKLQLEIQKKFKGASATPEQLKAVLGNPQNVKPEEVKWSGVMDEIDRLAQENNGKVPVQELMNYLRNEGQVKFNEVTLGGVSKLRTQDEIDQLERQAQRTGRWDEYEQAVLEFEDQQLGSNANQTGNLTKYAQYQLPGGENYREVVLSMPSDLSRSQAKIDAINKRRKEILDTSKEQDLFNRSQTDPEAKALNDSLTAEFVELGKQADQLNADIRDGKTGEQYTSTHFPDVPNYIAHMRLNERTDVEGNPGLFVEEFQSDRHQQGREKGYAGDLNKDRLNELANKSLREITKDEQEELKNLLKQRDALEGGGIPDAPFRKDWGVQLFKRALRDAVESGKSWIGWTTGETQAERYDLSKQVEEISVYQSNDRKGQFFISVRPKGSTDIGMQEVANGIPYDKVKDYLGEELAAKINPDKFGQQNFSGLDLKVGGEGMKGFYDTILPKEIGKYVSKMGGKVEKSEIGQEITENDLGMEGLEDATPEELAEFEATGKVVGETVPIWRVNITPEMENVVRAGQIQFMPAVQTIPERFTGTGQQGEERRGRYKAPPEFWTRFDIGEFERGGKFFDMETGEDITDKTYATGTIDVTGKRPSLISDTIIDEMPEGKGRTWKTNLFRKSAGWDWISENPPEVASIGKKEKPDPVLVSVESGKDHFYALKVDFPAGVKLQRYSDKPSEPRLRPTAKGEVQFGNEIGRIKTAKKEHPVYDTITIGQQFMPADSEGAMPVAKVLDVYERAKDPNLVRLGMDIDLFPGKREARVQVEFNNLEDVDKALSLSDNEDAISLPEWISATIESKIPGFKSSGWGYLSPEDIIDNKAMISVGEDVPAPENIIPFSPDIRFMPAEQGPLADIQAPEQRGEQKVLAEIEPVSDVPKLPKKYAYGYTTSSDRIKLVSDLAKSKNWNAIRDLNQATIRHAMSDLPGVKYTIKDVLGAFEDEREVSALPEFEINTPEELAAVRKRMVSLAELWDQTEVLEEEVGAGNELLLGTVDNDGYLHTGKYALTFDKLTPSMVEKARKAAGIQSMTIDGNTVIFYDTNNNPAKFERKVDRFGEFITENGGVLAGSEANIAKIRSYRNPQSPKAGSLYYNEDPVRLFGAGEAPDRLRTKVYRVVSELLGRPLPPPKDGRSSYFVKNDVTPKQVKLQNNIAKKQDAVVLNDKGNKDVLKAYEELNKELLKQYDALIDAGMEFYAAPDYETYEKTYKSSADVIADIRNNNKLVYLQTNPSTFGPQKNGKPLDFSFHPLLKNSGRKDKNGNEMNYNDILRVVHDAIAHGIYSAQFGPVGEESAWHTHIRTIDNPWARWALTMETRAQNSWVNYQDKFLNKEKMPKKPGDEGYIPIKQREYAMQKFALIPLKFALTGEAKVDKPVLELIEQIGPKRAEGSKERRADWMPSKQKEKEILSKVAQPPGDPKKLFADANSFLGKPTKKDGAESTPVIVAKEWFEKKTDQNDGEEGEEAGETITVGKAELKDVVLFSQTTMPLVVQPLPNYFAENNATKVSKNVLAIAKNPTVYKAYTDRVVAAGEKIKNDPQRFVTLSGYLEFMRESGASGNLLMPPSQLAEFVKKPQYVLDLWNGGYHGKKTIPGTIAAAKAGLDSVNEMRDLFIVDGKNLGPTPMITALHHLWGILSRQLDPLNQEGMWMRLVSDPAVIEQIQLSIDGKFTLSQEEWQKVVQNARKATKGEYSKIGNNATSNANAFHHMLKKHNGKWNELASIYTLDDAVKMTNAFWGLNVGATGIKNKVQRFIGLTFGIHGSVLDRWRFVSLNLPMAMKLRGAQNPESYFKYYGKNKTIPEDPVGIYKSYGTVENGNLVFSTALYAGIDKVIEGMIANSPEMRDFLGVHATAGGFHWIDWNCVKNEAVGHSSLDLTKEFLKRKGRKASAEDFLDVVKNTTVYTRADQDGKIFDLVMENGIFRVREE